LIAVVTFPRTNDWLGFSGILARKTTDGVIDPFVMSWSSATKVVFVGTIDVLPLTPVDTALPGSPKGTLALSSQNTSMHLSFSSTDLSFKYFSIALQ
jgi:hypothetical protein